MTPISILLILVVSFDVITSCAQAQGTMDDLYRLREKLFTNYTMDFRPAYNLSEPTHVTLEMLLISILDLDEISGTITLNCAFGIRWTDYRLAWDPNDFGGITSFTLNSSSLWKPRIYISTAADDLSDFSYDAFDVRIFSTGVVLTSPGRTVRASCKFDMTKFPKDSQTCVLQLMTWMLSASEMVFIIGRSDISLLYYTPNGEWEIDGTSVTNNTEFRPLSSIIDFTIHLSRRSAFFLITMTAPILLLCFLNPFVFLLPASSGERISYTITMFLSLAVYMTIIGENMPNISDPMAAISYFLLVAMVYSCLMTVLTIFTLCCHAVKDIRRFPVWLTWLVGRTMCKYARARHNKVQPADDGRIKTVKDSSEEMVEYERKVDDDNDFHVQVSKENVVNFIDRSLFCLTVLMIVVTWCGFWFRYWNEY
ncbi:neuronal acetylcholine receptor subunit alpha-3-like [Argopecten irradians]|uniref:neuronal acetylcholine receptor subunit alpha-3-like n=1 Tax=Argopecten irradians TaxID=31199 RepID=UPI00371834E3